MKSYGGTRRLTAAGEHLEYAPCHVEARTVADAEPATGPIRPAFADADRGAS